MAAEEALARKEIHDIVRYLKSSNAQNKLYGLSALWNATFTHGKYATKIIVDPSLGILEELRSALKDDFLVEKSLGALNNIAFRSDATDVLTIFGYGIHVLLLDIVIRFHVALENGKLTAFIEQICSSALLTLVKFARHSSATNSLKSVDILNTVSFLFVKDHVDANNVKVLFLVAFVIGRDDSSSKSSSNSKDYQVSVKSIEFILEMFHNTLTLRTDTIAYSFGDFELNVIIAGVLALSTNDGNKLMLIQSNLLTSLITTLRMYVENGPQLKARRSGFAGATGGAGGGGQDAETASLTIETMLQLSLFYESDEELRTNYMLPSTGIVSLLESSCQFGIDGSRAKLGHSALISAKRLLNRLVVHQTAAKPPADNGRCGGDRHVMMSYSWDPAAKPCYVKALTRALRELGYEVWRDEDGSSLVPPMSGSTVDRMAEAIDHCHTMIICVSEPYKHSANCRMEAQYANNLKRLGKLQLVFVMMDAGYTPLSSPIRCDGWLGFMIGDALWYQLWEESNIESSATQIAKLLARNEKVSVPASSSPAKSVDSTQSLIEKPASDLNKPSASQGASQNISPTVLTLPSAAVETLSSIDSSLSLLVTGYLSTAGKLTPWTLLAQADKSENPAESSRVVKELGISSDLELLVCTEQQIESIARYLKPIPRKAFYLLMEELRQTPPSLSLEVKQLRRMLSDVQTEVHSMESSLEQIRLLLEEIHSKGYDGGGPSTAVPIFNGGAPTQSVSTRFSAAKKVLSLGSVV